MTSTAPGGNRILGTLIEQDGTGVVRMEDRFDTDIDDLWSAVTDRDRLARWIGDFEGDLELGGEFRARYFASGWEGTGRVEVCEPPTRVRISTLAGEDSEPGSVELTLTADGDQTILVAEERGMPPAQLPDYGAGIQVHIEDLAAYLAGGQPCDAAARWAELRPAYGELPVR